VEKLITKNILLVGLVLGALVFYLYFINISFPHMTDSEIHLILSFFIFFITTCFLLYSLIFNRYYDLSFYFNVSWGFSVSLALLSLSSVQYELDYGFLFFLAICIFSFNLGYYLIRNNHNISVPNVNVINVFETLRFKMLFLLIFLICLLGYFYEIYTIGFVPLLTAYDEGFFHNRAGYLSIIHYFSTSLGAVAGASLAFSLITKNKFFYLIIFIFSFIAVLSLLAKNTVFLFFFFFMSSFVFFKKPTLKKIMLFLAIALFIFLFSSALRTGSSDYIQNYSRIDYYGLPNIFYWINTYFAINVTHLNTYFVEGFTPTYGTDIAGNFISLFFLKDYVDSFVGKRIVYFNGLGGNINVVPLFFVYLSDFDFLAFIPIFFLGMLSGFITNGFVEKRSFVYSLFYGGLLYALSLSVFADYLHRLMVPIAIFLLFIPYFFSVLKIRR